MKLGALLSAAAALTIAWSGASLASTPSKAHSSTHAKAAPVKLAPVDEYFGKMKLSPLGINNTIHDASLRLHYDPANAAHYYQSLAWAEDALRDWARKYPQDTWLPGRAYFMSHVFWQMNLPDGDAAANRCRQLLFSQFPKSHWASLAKNETKDKVAPVVSTATVEAAH